MSASLDITGFVSPEDKTYKKHFKVLKACIEAGIEELPRETAEYFKSPDPCEDLFEEKLEREIPYKEWSGEGCEGFEIKVSEIPEGVHTIRFSNCC